MVRCEESEPTDRAASAARRSSDAGGSAIRGDPLSPGRGARGLGPRVLTAALLLALVPPAAALIGGSLDTGERFGFVVALAAGDRRCTAAKIGPRTFLTAAHCVIDVPSGGFAPAFQPGGRVLVSNRSVPGAADYQSLAVTRTLLPPAFAVAFARLHDYQETQIADYQSRYVGEDLTRRVRHLQAQSRISDRFPDVALVRVGTDTPAIPVVAVDRGPLPAGAAVLLVGYGCERLARPGAGDPVTPRRTWGETRVIRVDPVNFYSFAAGLRSGTPSLCPGDSGGPVLRGGRVVGVHGTVWGLAARGPARSNMSVNLRSLADWEGWRD